MQGFNIDNSHNEYSNQEVFVGIKNIIQDSRREVFEKLILVSSCIGYISDAELLNNTVKILKDLNWSINDDRIKFIIKDASNSNNYTEEDLVRVESILYSNLLKYYFLKTNLAPGVEVKELQLILDKRQVISNYDDVYGSVKKALIKSKFSNSEDKLKDIKSLINAMNEIDYDNDTYTFDRDIKYLTTLKENLPDNIKYPPDYLDFFKDKIVFEKFDKWMKNSKDNPANKISFIFHRLKQNKELRNTKQKDFMLWAYDNNYIEEVTYKRLYEEGQFISAKNILSNTRNDIYDALIES